MVTIRTHQCNFCRENIPAENGIGLLWVGQALEAKPMNTVENHLCRSCCKALVSVLSPMFAPR